MNTNKGKSEKETGGDNTDPSKEREMEAQKAEILNKTINERGNISLEHKIYDEGKDRCRPTERIRKLERSFSSGSVLDRKRKIMATEATEEDRLIKKIENSAAFNLIETITALTENVNALEQHVFEYKNTNKKIIDIVLRMRRHVNVFKHTSITEWLNKHKYEKVETLKYDADIQVNMERGSHQSTTSTQTTPWINSDANSNHITTLNGIETYKDFIKTKDIQWSDEICTNTTIKIGNPINTKDSTTKVVLIEPNDTKMEHSIQQLYKERYPELEEMTDEISTIEQINKIKTNDGVKTINRRLIKAHIINEEEETM